MDSDNTTGKTGNESEKKEPVKVVLADNDKDDQEIFTDALNETNIPTEITTVDNGKELIDHLKDPSQPNPDIIFMDINMPVKDGKEALKEMKEDDTLKDIPTVMLSTSASPKDVDETFDAGASLYVRKPYSFRNFVLLLKKIFSLKWAGALLKPLRKSFFISEKDVGGESKQ
jgi:CheY-like chemotaxis protein